MKESLITTIKLIGANPLAYESHTLASMPVTTLSQPLEAYQSSRMASFMTASPNWTRRLFPSMTVQFYYML